MRFRRAPWVLGLLLALVPGTAQAELTHTVERGQTLGRIARRYHVSVEALREANNLRRGQQIHPGLALVIPEKGKNGEIKREAGASGHAAPSGTKGREKPAPARRVRYRPGFVRMKRGSENAEFQLLNRRGRLSPAALAELSRMLRFYPTGAKLAIDPRLAALLGTVSDHFQGRVIQVVSGFRPYSPVQYTPHSNHNLGRAMDFSIEGVSNTELRDFCRTFQNAGVGYYPNSTFVHLDVRSGRAYWIDYSHPGEAPHYDSAHSSSEEGVQEGEPHSGAEGGSAGAEGN